MAQVPITIAQADTSFGNVEVLRDFGRDNYNVLVNGGLKHPNIDADGAIRALSHYLQSDTTRSTN